MKASRRRSGNLLVELIMVVAIIGVLGAGATSVFSHAVRVRIKSEIATGNINALASEVKRLRSLPLSMFYLSDGITLRPNLTFYRKLSLPASSFSTNLFAKIDITLAQASGSAGPLQVFIVARPLYFAQVSEVGSEGLGTSETTGVGTIPNGIVISDLLEAQTFIVL